MSLLNIPTVAGLTINGVYKGTRVQNGKPNQQGQSIQSVLGGIAVKTTDAYGAVVEETFEFQFSQALVQQGWPAKMAVLEGTEISVPVWGRVWTGAKSSGVTYYLANTVSELIK